MPRQFKLPDLGEGVHEGQIVKLLVKEGESVREDQPLMEVETDKAAVEIPSPYTGIVQKIHCQANQIVNVGDVMFTFDDAAGAATSSSSTTRSTTSAASVASASPSKVHNGGGAALAPPRPSAGTIKPASPAVRKAARAKGVDINNISGSGPGGRVTMADVETATSGGGAPRASSAAVARSTIAKPPATADLRQAAVITNPPTAITAKPAALPEGKDESDAHGQVRRVPLTMARKTIAQNMSHSVQTIPHVTDHDDADITDLETFRKGYASAGGPQRKLRLLPFAVRAVARALQAFPIFNASFDHDKNEIVYHKYINIAIGMQTTRGLVTPVIRDADRLGVIEIADILDEMTNKARGSGFAVADMRGATFTISNAGAMGGSRYSTPIIIHPQVAVIALGRAKQMPWVKNDAIVPRLIQPISVSFDHRIIDGAEEIAFMHSIIDDLESPARLVL